MTGDSSTRQEAPFAVLAAAKEQQTHNNVDPSHFDEQHNKDVPTFPESRGKRSARCLPQMNDPNVTPQSTLRHLTGCPASMKPGSQLQMCVAPYSRTLLGTCDDGSQSANDQLEQQKGEFPLATASLKPALEDPLYVKNTFLAAADFSILPADDVNDYRSRTESCDAVLEPSRTHKLSMCPVTILEAFAELAEDDLYADVQEEEKEVDDSRSRVEEAKEAVPRVSHARSDSRSTVERHRELGGSETPHSILSPSAVPFVSSPDHNSETAEEGVSQSRGLRTGKESEKERAAAAAATTEIALEVLLPAGRYGPNRSAIMEEEDGIRGATSRRPGVLNVECAVESLGQPNVLHLDEDHSGVVSEKPAPFSSSCVSSHIFPATTTIDALTAVLTRTPPAAAFQYVDISPERGTSLGRRHLLEIPPGKAQQSHQSTESPKTFFTATKPLGFGRTPVADGTTRRKSKKSSQQKRATRQQEKFQKEASLSGKLDEMDGECTIMLRNIPNKYTQKMLLDVIDKNYRGLYDFFYLPIDFRNKCNVGYAFINFDHVHYARMFKNQFDGLKLEAFKSNKVCEVSWGRVQGLQANIEHYRNSAVMSIPNPEYKPLVFHHGVPAPFPTSDGPLPSVKLRPQKYS